MYNELLPMMKKSNFDVRCLYYRNFLKTVDSIIKVLNALDVPIADHHRPMLLKFVGIGVDATLQELKDFRKSLESSLATLKAKAQAGTDEDDVPLDQLFQAKQAQQGNVDLSACEMDNEGFYRVVSLFFLLLYVEIILQACMVVSEQQFR